ncbi:hypothetical protein TNCV_266421 [Trichonephila clavipes]|nr:hypothetical protein TNCV_266421 [Trichonephila clavipes]
MFKCIVLLRLGDTLNSRRAASPLVRLIEGDDKWEAPDHPQGFLRLNCGGTERNRTVTCMSCFSKGNDSVKSFVRNIPRQIVYDAIRRFKALDNDDRRPGSGRKRTANPSRNRKAIEKPVQRNLKASMRQIAHDREISEGSVTRF